MDAWRPELLDPIVRRQGLANPDLTEPRPHWVRTEDGVHLRVLDWGGAGPPVLLLHGGGLTARTWDYVGAALRDRYRLLALDMRGHGESGWSDDYGMDRRAEDCGEVLDALGLASAHLVGMSLGGITAAVFALTAPQMVRSLTLVDVAPGVAPEGAARIRALFEEVRDAASVEAVARKALGLSPLSDPDVIAYRMRAMMRQGRDGRWVWRRDGRRPTQFAEILARLEGLSGQAGQVRAPFLLLRGDRSKVLSAAAAAAFTARFADGRWLEISDAGHNVQEDNPLDLARALDGFLSATEAAVWS